MLTVAANPSSAAPNAETATTGDAAALPQPQHSIWWARIGVLACIAGAVWRYVWIFRLHPPTEYVYSDMAFYVEIAKRLLQPDYTGAIYDTIYPPAMGYSIAWCNALDPSNQLYVTLQFLMALAVPLLLGFIAKTLFDIRVAWLTLILASLWFPFVDYAGFFLAETPFMFFMLLSLCALLRGLLAKGTGGAIGWAVLSGFAFAISAEFKGQALMPAGLMALFLTYIFWKRQRKRILILQGAALLSALTIMLPVAAHVTRLNEGRPALVSTNGALMFLTGHHGHYGHLVFNDAPRNFYFISFNPTHVEHGNDGKSVYEFGAYDSDKIMQVAWKWIYNHKLESLQLSFDHIFDTFYGSLPWPSSSTVDRRWVITFQNIFLVGIFIPICIHLTQNWRAMVRLKPEVFGELFVFIPVLGLIVTVFLTMGEPRYRIPFDGFLLILAARYYLKRTAPRPQPFLETV